MNTFVLTLSTLLLLAVVAIASAAQEPTKQFYQDAFINWQKEHKKMYASPHEFARRFNIFTDNHKEIASLNSQKLSWTAGLNAFSDLTWAEFKARFNLGAQEEQHCSATSKPAQAERMELPPSFDWRYFGVVNPVKNQGHCGSCWAFSTTAAMESHWAIKTGKLFSLAEQQLVDCAGNYDNHGCSGGLPSHAFEYFKDNGGQTLETTYPYTAEDGTCTFQKNTAVAFTKGSYNITEGDEYDITHQILTSGPVSVGYQVVADFRHYKAGVYSSTTCKSGALDINHAVLSVGFNTTATGTPFHIIRNSWGPDWGMGGYFWMERGVNMCGIATCASRPLM